MLHRVPSTALKDVQEAAEVPLRIGMRIRDGVAPPGLRGEVDHALRSQPRKRCLYRITVADLNPFVVEPVVFLEKGETSLFERDVVVRVQVVEAAHLLSATQQSPRHVKADES